MRPLEDMPTGLRRPQLYFRYYHSVTVQGGKASFDWADACGELKAAQGING